jgi:hypothetical protein
MLAGPGGGGASTSSAESAAGGASTAPAVYVGPTGTVLHERHPYSMPAEAITIPGTLYLYAERVRIVAGRYEVEHPRQFAPREGSTLAAHRAALATAASGTASPHPGLSSAGTPQAAGPRSARSPCWTARSVS